jgi:RNA polymerase sigma factor (sigma-70 family)
MDFSSRNLIFPGKKFPTRLYIDVHKIEHRRYNKTIVHSSPDLPSMIKAFLSGDDDARESFCREYGSVALNIVNAKFPSLAQDEKRDIVQNTFVRLLNGGLKAFRGTTKYEFLAYLKQIVMNEAWTYMKESKEWKDMDSVEKEGGSEEDPLPPLQIPDGRPLPDRVAESNELFQLINKALSDYPLETKQVFLMKVEGHKDREVADVLGIPMGTVASQYSRTKERLRQLLNEWSPGRKST